MSKGTEQVMEKLRSELETLQVRHAAEFLMSVLVESFGPQVAKELDRDIRAGKEDAMRFLYGVASKVLAEAGPDNLPEGFEHLPGIYWEAAEQMKVNGTKH